MRYLRTWKDQPGDTEEIGWERWRELAVGWVGLDGLDAAIAEGFDSENAHYWTAAEFRDDIEAGEVWPEADDGPLLVLTPLEVELLESLDARLIDCTGRLR